MNNSESSRKISLPSKIAMALMVISADIFDDAALAAGVTGIGLVLVMAAWIYGFIISAAVSFWLYMLGVSMKWTLPGFIFELIPGLNALPARTAAMLVTFAKDEAETIMKIAPIINKSGIAKKAAKLVKKI